MSGVRSHAEAQAPEVAALAAGCDLLLYPPDLAQAIAAVEKAADRSESLSARLAESLGRSERMLAGFPTVDHSRIEVAGRVDGTALALAVATDCMTTVGDGVPEWIDPAEPVRVATIWDDREDPARPPFGMLFREALKVLGWDVLPPGPASPEVPIVVLVASTPQAWKGTAGLTVTARAALEGILGGGRAYPVVFGHPRLLAELGAPGLCAWATEPGMEPAAARALDALARERPGEAGI
jgi:hypothetical protein